MLTILLTTVLVALGLGVILWIFTLWAQSYIYDSPADGLAWRAPAAAGAVAAFLFVWTLIEYRKPGAVNTLFNFSSQRTTEFSKFVSVRKSETGEEKEIPYERQATGGGRMQFRDPKGTVWARSSSGMMVAILVDEDGETKRFNADMKDGKFTTSRPNEPLHYREENGRRYIVESELGKIYSTNRGGYVLVIFVNLLFFLVWFAVMWPLLRFQWAHALGFAAAAWLIATLVLAPYMLSRARDAAEKKARAKQTALRMSSPAASLAEKASRRAVALDRDRGGQVLA